MGAIYTRQSSYTDGDVITAADTNNEFDQLLATFAASTGHTHDNTTGEGGPITKLLGTSITIGDATSGTDITVTFDGESNDGVLKWMEDEDYFEFSDDILIATTEKIQFRDTAIYINSSADGQLDIVADTEIQIAATTIDMNGAADISGNLAVGGNLTVAGNATVTGTTTFNGGTLTLGDSASDNVVFGADVDSNIIPDDDDTYDLGSASQEWRNIFIDGTAHIDTLDVDVNATVAGTLGVTGAITGSSTLAVTGNVTMSADATVGDDLTLVSDAAVLGFGVNTDVTLTHVHDTGLLLNSTMALQFNDASQFINAPSATVLDITATDEIELNATAIDVNGTMDVSGTLGVTGIATFADDIIIGDGKTIGSASDIDAITIASNGQVTLTQTLIGTALDISGNIDIDGVTNLDVVDIDGAVDMASTLAVTGIATFTDDIIIGDGKTIGSTSDVDAITIAANGQLTLTQTLIGTALDISGDIDVDGTTNLDIVDIDGAVNIATTALVTGVLTTTATQVATGGITSGSNIVSDTDSTDDLGTTSVRWANLFVDGITATDQITATGFTGTLDGILGSGSTATASVTTLDTSGAVNLNLTTDSTSSTSGALIVDGGVGIAKKLFVGTDLDVDGTTNLDIVDIDGAVDMATTLAVAGNVDFNGDLDVDGTTNLDIVDIDGAVDMATTLAVAGNVDFNGDLDVDGTTNLDVVDIDGAVNIAADTTITSTNKIIFNDASQFIHAPSATVLDLAATDEIELTATLVDVVGNFTNSGTIVSTGKITADAGIDIDNFNIDGTTIALSSGNMTLDVAGNVTIDADGGTVTFADAGSSLGTITSSGYSGTSAVATTVTITDNEDTNENNVVVFVAGADSDGGNVGLESDGNLTYNPSTGTLSATNISVSGTLSTVDSVTMSANNAVVFEGATADAHETTLTSVDATADRTITLPNVSGTVPVLAAASNTQVTSTPAELNILDGVTSTAAELNILDGVTSTTAELNILDGVTSTAAELNILDGVTSTAAELNILDGVTSVAAELNILDVDNTTLGDLAEIGTIASGDTFIAIDASGGGLKKVTRATIVAGLSTASAIANVLEDTSPQLGGNLDTNSHNIFIDDAHFIGDESGNEQIVFQTTGSAVNHLEITNNASGSNPILAAAGGDTNIGIALTPKGTGEIVIAAGNLNYAGTAITSTGAELNILDGVTSTTAELNILDGVTSTAAELNALDGITAVVGELNALDIGSTAVGTAVGSKAVILDSNKDYTGMRNFTVSGELDAATLDISGNADIDGTLETDALSLNGTAVTSTAAELNILDGVTSTAAELNALDGITAVVGELNALDIGSTSVGTAVASKAVILDSNKDYTGMRNLTISGELDAGSLDISGNADIDGTLETDALSLNGTAVTSTAAELNILDGVTSTAAELNIMDGVTSTAAELNILDGVTSTAAELNALDGITAVVGELNALDIGSTAVGTAVASKAVILDSNKDYTGMRNLTVSGELDAGSLDISGNADIDGTLETDALSLNGTAVTSTAAELNILDGVTSTAAELNILDGVTSTAAELNILDGVTSTAAELNILDGVATTTAEINLIDGGTSRGTTAVASGDGILINDAGTMRMTNVNTVSTYFASHSVGGGNIVTTGALNSGTITSGFGTINNGSSTITTSGTVSTGAITAGGNLTRGGTVILDGSITDTGTFTIDVAGDIILDADGTAVLLKDAGTEYGRIFNSSTNIVIKSAVSDKDMIFQGNDGGSTITALTLDMSAAGAATFNNDVTAFSDERLKSNITTIPDALSKVTEMRGVHYVRDATGKDSTGVIAQELQKIAPELVLTAEDEMGTLSVNYGNITGYLIEAIKELKAEINELKRKQ